MMKQQFILSLAATALLTLNSLSDPAVLLNRYSFNNEGSAIAADSVGAQNGLLESGAVQAGGSVWLDGSAMSYVELPSYLIEPATITQEAVTLEAWASFGGLQTWARLFDFGNSDPGTGFGGNYLFFTPIGQGPSIRLIVSSAFPYGFNGEDGVNIPGSLDWADDLHIVCVVDFGLDRAAIYINGSLIGEDSFFTKSLWDINNVYSYLGKSLYTPDPNMVGSIDEFRIYDGALTASEIEANFMDGPSGLDPFIVISSDPWGPGVTNRPVLEAVIADRLSEVDPASIVLSLDGVAIAPSISRTGPTTTVSYAVAEPLEALSTHTIRLAAAGMNPPADTITNTWTFTVIGSGVPVRVYVDATHGPDGNTMAWNPITSMFEEWNPLGTTADDNLWERFSEGNNETSYACTTYEDAPRLRTTATGLAPGAYKVYVYIWGINPSWESWYILAALNNGASALPVYDLTSAGVVKHYLDINPADSFDGVYPAVYSSAMSWNPFISDVKIAEYDMRLYEVALGIAAVTDGTLSVYIDDPYMPALWGVSRYDGIGYEPLEIEPGAFVTGGGWIWSPPGALPRKYDPTDLPASPAASTVAHWDFADPDAKDGAFMPGNAVRDDLNGDGLIDSADFRISSLDLSGNGNHITAQYSSLMRWSDDSIQGDYSMENADPYPWTQTDSLLNPYITGIDAETIIPAQWTIETVFKLHQLNAYSTIVGRDDMRDVGYGYAAALYFSARGSDLAIDYADVEGADHILQIAAGLRINTWYRAAAVSDGSTLFLYLDDEVIGALDLTVTGTDTALSQGFGTWSVSRGMFNGGPVDAVIGLVDEVAISDAALTPDTFVIQPYVPVQGRAEFSFNAKYNKDLTVPKGQIEFQFRAGDLNFHSSDYDWLVTSDAEARLQGSGTINHEPGFRFMLTATDGDLHGSQGDDHIHMQIWDTTSGEVIYDNKADTRLQGGNIVIHHRRRK